MQDEFYAIAFRKNIYDNREQLQQDLDVWMEDYNTVRTHSGKYGYGKTPMQTFEEAKHLYAKATISSDSGNASNCWRITRNCQVKSWQVQLKGDRFPILNMAYSAVQLKRTRHQTLAPLGAVAIYQSVDDVHAHS